MEDPYKILGLKASATRDEVERAYRRKAMTSHPDTGGDRQEFQRVVEAYEQIVQAEDGQKNAEPPTQPTRSPTFYAYSKAADDSPAAGKTSSSRPFPEPIPTATPPVPGVPKPRYRIFSSLFELLFAASALIIFVGLIIVVFAIGAVSHLSRNEDKDKPENPPPALHAPVTADELDENSSPAVTADSNEKQPGEGAKVEDPTQGSESGTE